jgi:hypothetical protein
VDGDSAACYVRAHHSPFCVLQLAWMEVFPAQLELIKIYQDDDDDDIFFVAK